MEGKAVTIRLLDPPLPEFVPHDEKKLEALSKELNVSMADLERRILGLKKTTQCLDTEGAFRNQLSRSYRNANACDFRSSTRNH